MDIDVKNIKCKPVAKSQDLDTLSKEELIDKVRQLEAHVFQLRNILKPKEKTTTSAASKKRRPFDFKKNARRHVLLHISYTGWDYLGYVTQEHTEKTIEAELFRALQMTCLIESRETSNYHRCGRTDKGVSSFGQTISIDLRSNLSEGVGVYVPEGHTLRNKSKENAEEIHYSRILNGVLPEGIRVIAWSPVGEALSARFDCVGRTYHYYFPKSNLDIDKMRTACQFLIGEHDFRNLCKMDVGNGVIQFNRNIQSVEIKSLDEGKENENGYSMYCLRLTGRAFLWHQIRCIVAVLFLVGNGKEEPSIIQELFDVEKNPRKPQYGMASELPLNLFACSYEGVEWIHDNEALLHLITHYQSMWTENSVKATMLKEMLGQLEGLIDTQVTNQCKQLVLGVEAKPYQPLLQRLKCSSLEERIDHYAKRKRIEIIDTSENDQSIT